LLAKGDASGNVVTTPVDAESSPKVELDTSVEDQGLPICGSCNKRLSFPFWYCIFCSDDLFICNACDEAGVLDLERDFEKHTEEHHLIRCFAPEKKDDDALPTEQRLTAIEGRLDGMQTQLQTQLDVLTGRMGVLTGQIGDLHTRMGNIEQLLLKLAGESGSAASS